MQLFLKYQYFYFSVKAAKTSCRVRQSLKFDLPVCKTMHVIDEYAKARYPVLSSMRGQYLTHILVKSLNFLKSKVTNELINKYQITLLYLMLLLPQHQVNAAAHWQLWQCTSYQQFNKKQQTTIHIHSNQKTMLKIKRRERVRLSILFIIHKINILCLCISCFFCRFLEAFTWQVNFCFVYVILADKLHDIKKCPCSQKALNTMCSTFFFYMHAP